MAMDGIMGAGISGTTGITVIREDGIHGTMEDGTAALSRSIRYTAAVRQAQHLLL